MTEQRAKDRKRREYLRAIGRPSLMHGPEVDRARARVRSFKARGMTYAEMERQSGVAWRTIAWLAEENRQGIRRSTWEPLMRLEFVPGGRGSLIDPTGTRRRIKAMWADGFPLPWISEQIGRQTRYVQHMIHDEKSNSGVSYPTWEAVSALYEKVDGCQPEDFGIITRSAKFSRTFAFKRGYDPRSCWDPDTIDDPQALPEYTGHCGTEQGYQIHYRDKLNKFWEPTLKRLVYGCPACRRAHLIYKGGTPGAKRGRPGRTHCDKNHELVGDNVYMRPDGRGRMCAVCNRERANAKQPSRPVGQED